MAELPTVKVASDHPDHEQGYYVINESDFDATVHRLFVMGREEQVRVQKTRQGRGQR
jgi:hypothetical protein